MKRATTKILAFIACLAMIFAMTACGGGASSSVSQAPSSSAPAVSSSEPDSSSVADSSLPDSSVSMADSSAPAGTQSSGELSDDWQSQQVEVNGVVYTFPVASVQEFLDNGWVCDDALDFTMPANTRTSGYTFRSGEQYISLSFLNSSGETKDIMDCYVEALSFGLHPYTKGASVILPGGIQHESSYDDVIAAWGEPSDESDTGSSLTLEYGGPYNYYNLTFDYEDKAVNGIFVSFDTPLA